MTDVAVGDAEAREQAIVLPNSVLVQAPAGSGKTTLLTQRYLRLLAHASVPENILALTFTRRAAQEMRERVVRALECARAPVAPADLGTRTWELAIAAVRRLDGAGIDLAAHPARMRIETIDAFNAWLAAQLPVSARTGARLATVEDAGFLYQEAARRALAYEAPDEFGAAVERVLALGDQRWASLTTYIAKMLPSRDHWLPLIAGGLEAASALDAAASLRLRARFDADLGLTDSLHSRVSSRRSRPGSAMRGPSSRRGGLMRPACARTRRTCPGGAACSVWYCSRMERFARG